MKKILIIFILSISLLNLSACKKGKDYEPEKIVAEHQFFDDNFYNYIRYINYPYSNNNSIIFKQSLTAYMGVKNGTSRSINSYQYDYSHSKLEIYYNLDPRKLEGGTLRRFSHEFLPEYLFDEKIKSISGKVNYSYKEDAIEHIKTYTFKEIFFNEGFIDSSFTEEKQIVEFTFSIISNSNENFNRLKINAIIPKTNNPFHLDFQTFIKTKSGDVYPFLGIYNYNLIDEDYLSISDLKLDKEIDIDYLLIYAEYNNGTTIEVIKQKILNTLTK